MWIKICGNTRLQDCLLASDLGADAVGFVFAEGKRTVTAEHIAGITAHLPASIEKIGVFTSTNARDIVQTAKVAGLTGIQLHGQYDPQLVQAVLAEVSTDRPVRLLQVVHWDLDQTAMVQMADFTASVSRIAADGLVDAILVDSRTAQKSGGTGKTFDWHAAAPVLRAASLPVIVAGGLNAENVVNAVRTTGPQGVDVSSGVEDRPGVKNADALRRFLQNARA